MFNAGAPSRMSGPKDSRASAAPHPLLVLVTGITGQQGGHVARQLLRRGHRVRALTRNPDHPKLQEFRAQGVDVRAGGFDDAPSIQEAARGVDAMFLMGTPIAGADTEARQGKSAVDAARSVGVPWLVYSSVSDADRNTGIPHFESKFAVEEHLRASGVPSAVSAPTAFMENLLAPYQLPSLRQGKIAAGTSPDRPIQMVALDDLSAFVTTVLENPSRFSGKRINVASDAMSEAEVVQVLSKVTGRPIEYQQIPIDALRKQKPDFAKMYEFFERRGYTADIDGLRRDYPEVPWQRFGEWAARQDWPHLLA
jgi:uncharacterized protein YbjT (DUF2867 family)